MKSWIRFVDGPPATKTKRWTVQTANGNHDLGIVSWIARWRCYGFEPFRDTVFEWDCLREIAAFCEQQTKQHKGPL